MVEHATGRTIAIISQTTLHHVLDELRTMSAGSVTIALDPLSTLFSTPDHYRALDAVRLARSLAVTFLVDDAHRMGLALAFGYQVRPRELNGFALKNGMGSAEPPLRTSQLEVHPTTPPARAAHHSTVAPPLPQRSAAAIPPAVEPEREAVGRPARTVRHVRRARRWLWSVSLSLIGLLALACGAGVIVESRVHTADIVLHPAEQQFSRVVSFAIADGPTDDPNAIRATTFETSVAREMDAPATGQTTVPDGTASGVMTLRSRADGATTIKAGTALRGPKDISYIVQADVTVPGLDFVRGQLGEARAQVKAAAPGSVGNLSAGFSNRYTENVTYISGEITGGTEKQVAAVTDSDIAAARSLLEAEIRKNALASVNAALPAGMTALNDNLVLRASTVSAQPPVGAQADSVHVKVTMPAQIPVYRNADFDAFIDRKLNDAVRETSDQLAGQARVVPESIVKGKPVFVDAQGSLVRYFATVTGTTRAVITDADLSRLRQSLTGKDRTRVVQVLAAEKEIGAHEIRVGPEWLPAVIRDRMPRSGSHIGIRVE